MFYVRANSALSLRALKKHLTSFKRLSRPATIIDAPSNWAERKEGPENYRGFGSVCVSSSFLPRYFSFFLFLFLSFFFNDRYLLTQGRGGGRATRG